MGQGYNPQGQGQGQGFIPNNQGQGFVPNNQQMGGQEGKSMGVWTQEVGGKEGKPFCEMPTAVKSIKIRSGNVIDSIQIVCTEFMGTLHGGTGGKEHTWNAFNGVTKILISHHSHSTIGAHLLAAEKDVFLSDLRLAPLH